MEKGALPSLAVAAGEAEGAAQVADTRVAEAAGVLAAGVEPEPSM